MHLRGNLMLLMAAFIWGTTFVAQLVGMAGLGPFAFSFARYLLGLIFLVGLVFAFRGQRQAAGGHLPTGVCRGAWRRRHHAGGIELSAVCNALHLGGKDCVHHGALPRLCAAGIGTSRAKAAH